MPEPAFRFRPREPEPEESPVPRRLEGAVRALRSQVNMEGFSGSFTYTRDGETRSREVEGRFFKLTSVDGIFRIPNRPRPREGDDGTEFTTREFVFQIPDDPRDLGRIFGRLDNGKYVEVFDTSIRFTYALGGRETYVSITVHTGENRTFTWTGANGRTREVNYQSFVELVSTGDNSFQFDGRTQPRGSHQVVFGDIGDGETRSIARVHRNDGSGEEDIYPIHDAPLITVINAEGRKAFNIALGGYP